MPRYIIERHFGDFDDATFDSPEWKAKAEPIAEEFSEITWLHSHLMQGEDGLVTYCIYDAPSADYIRQHAAALGVPADRVTECWERQPD